VLRYKTKLDLV